ncbi:MAG: MerR family transcriptional regulator [Flavobacteriaceae bacterium]|nr:MerR family transcriptional regulator [Flavobacteriaceae bacterium]|tara:strand:- start:5281 stop:6204 length:924 start_codon:yes stop_codon:yes gene_type:complete
MNRIKSTFSIKNLEKISGIKAHTLRIWEKRYNLLEPERTDTNIRRYSLDSLKTLLNVTLLYNHGFKISKIASLSEDEIPDLVRNIALKSNSEQVSINAFKLAMINFDCELFDNNYDEILQHHNFEYVFIDIFMPLMKELGILWQTGAISPTHEHFITNLVKQKIHVQSELLQRTTNFKQDQPIFALFLPENEIHELGILYLNYLILSEGYRTIFLGQSLQTSSLETLYTYNTTFNFVTYITVEPNKDDIMPYLNDFHEKLLSKTDSKLIIFGPQQLEIDTETLPRKIELYRSVESFITNYFMENVFV